MGAPRWQHCTPVQTGLTGSTPLFRGEHACICKGLLHRAWCKAGASTPAMVPHASRRFPHLPQAERLLWGCTEGHGVRQCQVSSVRPACSSSMHADAGIFSTACCRVARGQLRGGGGLRPTTGEPCKTGPLACMLLPSYLASGQPKRPAPHRLRCYQRGTNNTARLQVRSKRHLHDTTGPRIRQAGQLQRRPRVLQSVRHLGADAVLNAMRLMSGCRGAAIQAAEGRRTSCICCSHLATCNLMNPLPSLPSSSPLHPGCCASWALRRRLGAGT